MIAGLGGGGGRYGRARQYTVLWTKVKDKRRPAEGEPGRTGEMEGGDGSRLVLAYRTLWERI